MTAPEDPFRTPPPGGSPDPSPYGTPPPGYEQPAYGQPPAYGQQPYGQPVAAPRNGLGTAALVLGVLGLVSWFFLIGGLLGLVAVVLGVIGRRRAQRGEATNGGVALAGIVTGVIALLLGIATVAGTIALLGDDDLRSCIESATTQAERDQCAEDFVNG